MIPSPPIASPSPVYHLPSKELVLEDKFDKIKRINKEARVTYEKKEVLLNATLKQYYDSMGKNLTEMGIEDKKTNRN